MNFKISVTLLLLLHTTLVVSQRMNEEQFLVAPYLQFSTQTGMYILWETRDLASSRVDFGEARWNVNKAVLDRSVSLPGTRSMHELLLNELTPETNYFWQAISITTKGDTLRSPVYSFKTAVRDSSAFTFALIGDSQRNNKTLWAWKKIADLIWQDRPNLAVLAGDLVDQGLDKND